MVVANNQKDENRVSNIDIEQMKFSNYDSVQYQDSTKLAAEALELSAESKNIKKQEDGSYKATDLLAHKLQMHLEEENRKAHTFLQENDSKTNMLFKHYENLLSYWRAFDELIKRAD